MQISMLMRSPKVKRSRKQRLGENLTVAPTIAYHTIDFMIKTFAMHRNDGNDATDYFDIHLRSFNTY